MFVCIHRDIGYRISEKSLFRYPILCRTPLSQSDIGRSDIRLSPISLITDIGLSAHLCLKHIDEGPLQYVHTTVCTVCRVLLSTHNVRIIGFKFDSFDEMFPLWPFFVIRTHMVLDNYTEAFSNVAKMHRDVQFCISFLSS